MEEASGVARWALQGSPSPSSYVRRDDRARQSKLLVGERHLHCRDIVWSTFFFSCLLAGGEVRGGLGFQG